MKSATSSTFEGLRRAAARGVLYAWLFIALDFLVLAVLFRGRLSGMWELTTGFFGLAPSWMLLGALPGACGGAAAQLLVRGASRRRPAASRLTLSLFAFAFGALIGWGVGGGRHLADWGVRGGFATVVGCVGAVAVFSVLPYVQKLSRSPQGRRLLAAGVGVAALVCELVNLTVLVRLYPAFHAGLSTLTLACSGAAGVLLEGGLPRLGRRRKWTVATLVAAAVLLILPASRSIMGFDNLRWLLLQNSPTLSWGVRAAALLSPPPPFDERLAQLPLGSKKPSSDVDLRGQDILLISIDALRADHVGAYGYQRPVSPQMDALAKRGVRFQAAYAPTPHTSYSVTSLMTGKYMRPLLLQGAGTDSDLFASLLRDYGYRTAAFYPPAIFYIDTPRFFPFQKQNLAFEYAKVEFAEGQKRLDQVGEYLDTVPRDKNVFLWVHLFGPHEPYVRQPGYDFGSKDVDLYDSEIRAADDTVGELVRLMEKRNPGAMIVLTADHGEEFGDHGGRYHGTTVYDEQVRVPLVVVGEGVAEGRVVQQPVQTIDILPTVLGALRVPVPPRIRGRDLTKLLSPKEAEPPHALGRAVAETDDYTLLAQGPHRLICHRRGGACQLFDIQTDPRQREDLSSTLPEVQRELREVGRAIAESHGKFESEGLRAEGQGWPAPILLGLSGNAEVTPELARLLDDADPSIRRKAAELLFQLGAEGQAPALRLALSREEDEDTRAFLALALTSLGQGAPLVFELLREGNVQMRRLAALALAEQENDAGEKVLLTWWHDRKHLTHPQAQRLLLALGKIRSRMAVPFLVQGLSDERLRSDLAATLAQIGDKDAKPFLARQLLQERYHSARAPLSRALLALGAKEELVVPLRRFLGVPDPIPEGLAIAVQARILDDLGGPKNEDLKKLRQLSDSGVRLTVIVPTAPPGQPRGVRLLVRARTRSGDEGKVYVEPAAPLPPKKEGQSRPRRQPLIDHDSALVLTVQTHAANHEGDAFAPAPPADVGAWQEVYAMLPEEFGARPGHHLGLEVYAPEDVEIAALAAVPLRTDLPPPQPQPWKDQKSEASAREELRE